MKNNFNFDLPFNKPLKFHAMTIIIRSVFEENGSIIHKLFQASACMSYENVAIPRN